VTNSHSVVRLQLPLNRIQTVRLAHAIMEAGYEVQVPEAERAQFEHLAEIFPIRFSVGESATPLPGVEFVHSLPRTKVGVLERPLIFPHVQFTHCREIWKSPRDVRFFFAGHITPERSETLQRWAGTAGVTLRIPKPSGWLSKLLHRSESKMQPSITTDGEVVLWSSERGRAKELKGWDEDYFQAMAGAQFVLCPSGDFVWTYRFFEAAMCGAIPIVEDTCAAYEGFHFFSMKQPASELRWNTETVEHNYRLCRERLTIPQEELAQEIRRLLTN
jgi:hypothetical protein